MMTDGVCSRKESERKSGRDNERENEKANEKEGGLCYTVHSIIECIEEMFTVTVTCRHPQGIIHSPALVYDCVSA